MALGIMAGVGAATSLAGSFMGANAAQSAAEAQEAQARRYQDFVNGQTEKAMNLVKNPADLAAYDEALTAQRSVVQKQKALADSLSPNLIEIGKQLHGLMTGQSAPALDNLKQQRALQRTQLVDNLTQKLGPGAESSSAGIQALNQFDQETANTLQQAQSDYTKTFMSASLSSPEVINALGGANKDLTALQAQSPGQRQANILMGALGPQGQAAQMSINAAGAGAVANQFMGQGIQQLGQSGIMGAAMMAGRNSVNKPAAPVGAPAET